MVSIKYSLWAAPKATTVAHIQMSSYFHDNQSCSSFKFLTLQMLSALQIIPCICLSLNSLYPVITMCVFCFQNSARIYSFFSILTFGHQQPSAFKTVLALLIYIFPQFLLYSSTMTNHKISCIVSATHPLAILQCFLGIFRINCTFLYNCIPACA